MEGEYAGIFMIHCGSHLVKKTTNSNVNEYEYLLCSIMETIDKIINKKKNKVLLLMEFMFRETEN